MAAVATIQHNVQTLERAGLLGELAKWTWFKRKFRSSLEATPVEALNAFGISLDDLPWGS
jgi:hypothetical protein